MTNVAMTVDELKAWARGSGNVSLVAELVSGGCELKPALEHVWDMKNLSKEDFVKKYFGW